MLETKAVESNQPSAPGVKKYVLIGAGPASVRAAETLRKADPR